MALETIIVMSCPTGRLELSLDATGTKKWTEKGEEYSGPTGKVTGINWVPLADTKQENVRVTFDGVTTNENAKVGKGRLTDVAYDPELPPGITVQVERHGR